MSRLPGILGHLPVFTACQTLPVLRHMMYVYPPLHMSLMWSHAVQTAAKHWAESGAAVPDGVEHKFLSMADFCTRHDVQSVPDPYYGGAQGFEQVRLVQRLPACRGL